MLADQIAVFILQRMGVVGERFILAVVLLEQLLKVPQELDRLTVAAALDPLPVGVVEVIVGTARIDLQQPVLGVPLVIGRRAAVDRGDLLSRGSKGCGVKR
jgi:hypothetical protein